jgi:hypothetical protein
MKSVLVATTLAFSLGGCATVFNGESQSVVIASKPEGAAVSVTNSAGMAVHSGQTPLTLSLKRGAGYFKPESYTIRFEKAGHETKEVIVTGTMSGWYIGNILVGGLIGMLAVDPITGAMYTFPERIEHELAAAEGAKTSATPGTLRLVLTDALTKDQLAQARVVGKVQ